MFLKHPQKEDVAIYSFHFTKTGIKCYQSYIKIIIFGVRLNMKEETVLKFD